MQEELREARDGGSLEHLGKDKQRAEESKRDSPNGGDRQNHA